MTARLRATFLAAAAALVLAAAPSAAQPHAGAADCPPPVPYPGDDASREALATWMAGATQRSRAALTPPEMGGTGFEPVTSRL